MNKLLNIPPVYVMAKPIGAACNLRCEYCYYIEKKNLYSSEQKMMSDSTLEHYIKTYIESSFSDNILFSWHGGETLLAGIDFFRKAVKLQNQYAGGKIISNTIQTNGVLLTGEWCEFFKEHQFLVGISIDGTEEIHDKYRKTITGNGSYKEVVKGIELLKQYGVEFNALATLNDYSVRYPLVVYNHLKSLGCKYMQFAPIVERIGTREDALKLLSGNDSPGKVRVTPWSVSSVDFGRFYSTLFKEWYEKDIGQIFVQFFDTVISLYMKLPPPVCTHAVNCGNALVMESNGDIYSCDHYVFPENKLGNIRTSPLLEMAHSPQQVSFGKTKAGNLSNECLQCPFLAMCNGGCPKNRIKVDADGLPVNYLCEGLKLFFKQNISDIKQIAFQIQNNK